MNRTLGIASRLGVCLLLVGATLAFGQANGDSPRPNVGKTPERIKVGGIENTFRLSPRLYSGGDPRGAEAFQALKALGIKTIVSVDGTMPDVATARALGMRYVHLPIGYDGVPREQALRLVQVMKTMPGPVYVHCHHGKHRGPAAAAVCGIASEGWSKEAAVAWMKEAGTSADYPGLYDSTRAFMLPSVAELNRVGKDLPERAKVPALVETMVRVDERWDHLKAARASGFAAPADMPDIDPPHEALQLVELFREAARVPREPKRGEAFLAAVSKAERESARLESALRAFGKSRSEAGKREVEAAFEAVGKSCVDCHSKQRDK